ncbi:ABC transporter substrate binding protein [Massilia sp. W12]|uniref:ABC transporter substrate-binding protein n=1 Tax=Massilia sp. W12 TaxID=3126507 RepID=UPI0030D23677
MDKSNQRSSFLWLFLTVLCLLYTSSQAEESKTLSNMVALSATGIDSYFINSVRHTQQQNSVNTESTINILNLFPAKYAKVDYQIAQADIKRQINPEAIAVVFPDIGEPYRSIFLKIIEGIEDQLKTKVKSVPIPANMESAELNNQLKRSGVKVVIALGQRGYKLATGLDRDIGIVVGGVLTVPESDHNQYTVISLTPDPNLLFSQLKKLIPGIKRVIVVYNPNNSEWLMRLARLAAKNQGLELLTIEAKDLATAAHQYESVFATADGRFDSVWLPQDSTTVEENTIMPLVLKESWNKSVPIFSSNFLHVKKGALFALYPNNLEMGKYLAQNAQILLSGDNSKRGLIPLKDVQAALNTRTATRIGLAIGQQKQRAFDFIFPEQ